MGPMSPLLSSLVERDHVKGHKTGSCNVFRTHRISGRLGCPGSYLEKATTVLSVTFDTYQMDTRR